MGWDFGSRGSVTEKGTLVLNYHYDCTIQHLQRVLNTRNVVDAKEALHSGRDAATEAELGVVNITMSFSREGRI